MVVVRCWWSICIVGLTRGIVASPDVSATRSANTRYQVQTQGKVPKVVGALVAQPPRIILGSSASIELSGDKLRTEVDWTVTSILDLEGTLSVRIPNVTSPVVPDDKNGSVDGTSEVGGPGTEQAADAAADTSGSKKEPVDPHAKEPWLVTIGGTPAKLKYIEGDRYQLISPAINTEPMDIKWIRIQDLNEVVGDGTVVAVPLPSPDVLDVTIRGNIDVTLRGAQKFDLVSADRQRKKRLDLPTFPREPLLKLLSHLTSPEELTVQKTVLRTVVGRNLRHESVHAKVQGGDSFKVGLPVDIADVSVQAFIDGDRRTVRREENNLVVPLPGDSGSHVVDLQVWFPRETPASFSKIQPMLRCHSASAECTGVAANGHVLGPRPPGRSMSWRFDRWKLYRQPTHDDRRLLRLMMDLGRDTSR